MIIYVVTRDVAYEITNEFLGAFTVESKAIREAESFWHRPNNAGKGEDITVASYKTNAKWKDHPKGDWGLVSVIWANGKRQKDV